MNGLHRRTWISQPGRRRSHPINKKSHSSFRTCAHTIARGVIKTEQMHWELLVDSAQIKIRTPMIIYFQNFHCALTWRRR